MNVSWWNTADADEGKASAGLDCIFLIKKI